MTISKDDIPARRASFDPFKINEAEAGSLLDLHRDHDPGEAAEVSAVDATTQRAFLLSEVAKMFGKSPRTARSWADKGLIRTFKFNGKRWVTRAEIVRLTAEKEG